MWQILLYGLAILGAALVLIIAAIVYVGIRDLDEDDDDDDQEEGWK
jgi:hypothetical protein